MPPPTPHHNVAFPDLSCYFMLCLVYWSLLHHMNMDPFLFSPLFLSFIFQTFFPRLSFAPIIFPIFHIFHITRGRGAGVEVEQEGGGGRGEREGGKEAACVIIHDFYA